MSEEHSTTLRQAGNDLVNNLKERVDALSSDQKAHDELNREFMTVREKNTVLTVQLQDAMSRRSDLASENEVLKTKLQERDDTLATTKTQLFDVRLRLSEAMLKFRDDPIMQGQLRDFQAQNNQLQAQLKTAHDETAFHKEEVKRQEDLYQNSASENQALKEAISDAQGKIGAFDNERIKYKEACQLNTDDKCRELENAAREKLQMLEQKLKGQEMASSKLIEKIRDASKKEVAEQQEKFDQLQTRYDKTSEDYEQLQERIKSFGDSYGDVASKLQHQEDQIKECWKIIQSTGASLDEHRDGLERVKQDTSQELIKIVEQYNLEKDDWYKQEKKLKAEITSLKSSIEPRQTHIVPKQSVAYKGLKNVSNGVEIPDSQARTSQELITAPTQNLPARRVAHRGKNCTRSKSMTHITEVITSKSTIIQKRQESHGSRQIQDIHQQDEITPFGNLPVLSSPLSALSSDDFNGINEFLGTQAMPEQVTLQGSSTGLSATARPHTSQKAGRRANGDRVADTQLSPKSHQISNGFGQNLEQPIASMRPPHMGPSPEEEANNRRVAKPGKSALKRSARRLSSEQSQPEDDPSTSDRVDALAMAPHASSTKDVKQPVTLDRRIIQTAYNRPVSGYKTAVVRSRSRTTMPSHNAMSSPQIPLSIPQRSKIKRQLSKSEHSTQLMPVNKRARLEIAT